MVVDFSSDMRRPWANLALAVGLLVLVVGCATSNPPPPSTQSSGSGGGAPVSKSRGSVGDGKHQTKSISTESVAGPALLGEQRLELMEEVCVALLMDEIKSWTAAEWKQYVEILDLPSDECISMAQTAFSNTLNGMTRDALRTNKRRQKSCLYSSI